MRSGSSGTASAVPSLAQWARANGLTLGRGRPSREIVAAYEEATGIKVAPPPAKSKVRRGPATTRERRPRVPNSRPSAAQLRELAQLVQVGLTLADGAVVSALGLPADWRLQPFELETGSRVIADVLAPIPATWRVLAKASKGGPYVGLGLWAVLVSAPRAAAAGVLAPDLAAQLQGVALALLGVDVAAMVASDGSEGSTGPSEPAEDAQGPAGAPEPPGGSEGSTGPVSPLDADEAAPVVAGGDAG